MAFQPPREKMGKEDLKTMCLFSGGGGQFKYPVGMVLSIFREGSSLAGFLRDGVWTEATPRGGGLGWNFHPNIPDSLDIWMPGAVVWP